MKHYEREYERVFSGTELVNKKCNLNKVSPKGEGVESTAEYVNVFADTLNSFEMSIFDHLVKYIWLVRKFTYDGRHRSKPSRNGIELDRAFGVFVRSHVGYDNRFFLAGTAPFGKISTYFDSLFPNFDLGNPFEENYEYPYTTVTLSHMLFVYQMEERMELLQYAEDKKMGYTEFMDYVLNYISCLNAEQGDKYLFVFSHVFMPYIKNTKK